MIYDAKQNRLSPLSLSSPDVSTHFRFPFLQRREEKNWGVITERRGAKFCCCKKKGYVRICIFFGATYQLFTPKCAGLCCSWINPQAKFCCCKKKGYVHTYTYIFFRATYQLFTPRCAGLCWLNKPTSKKNHFELVEGLI